MHRGADEYSAEGLVAAGHGLREGHEVGPDAEVLGTEPAAQPTEPGDHLVEDQERAVGVAQVPQAREIPGTRRIHTARPDHGLCDDRGHPTGPVRHDRCHGIQVVLVHPDDVADTRAEAGPVRGQAGQAHAAVGDAVVARRPADDDRPLRFAGDCVCQAGDLRGRVHRFRSAAGQKHPGARHGCQRGESLGERVGRRVGEPLEQVEGVESPQLRRHRFDDFFAAVSGCAVPQTRHGVDVAPTGVVHNVRTLAGDDADERVRRRSRARERVQ